MSQKQAESMFQQKIRVFSKLMLQKLEAKQYENDDTWDICSDNYLLKRMYEEIGEIVDVLKEEPPPYESSQWYIWHKRLALECADVANFAMMVADRLGILGETNDPKTK